MSYVVALTGGIGSGKSTIANIFVNLGIPIIDSDIISRKIVHPHSQILSLIVKRFGSMILYDNGTLNRAALRERIFRIAEDKIWLNNLLHPIIQQLTEQQIRTTYANARYILWVVPLLLENNLQQYADRILVVDVRPEIQIVRTLTRDNISRQQIENIITAQISREQRLIYADDIIDNNGTIDKINKQIYLLNKCYCSLADLKKKHKSK